MFVDKSKVQTCLTFTVTPHVDSQQRAEAKYQLCRDLMKLSAVEDSRAASKLCFIPDCNKFSSHFFFFFSVSTNLHLDALQLCCSLCCSAGRHYGQASLCSHYNKGFLASSSSSSSSLRVSGVLGSLSTPPPPPPLLCGREGRRLCDNLALSLRS